MTDDNCFIMHIVTHCVIKWILARVCSFAEQPVNVVVEESTISISFHLISSKGGKKTNKMDQICSDKENREEVESQIQNEDMRKKGRVW